MPRSFLALGLAIFALPAAAQGTFVSAQSGTWNAPATWTLTAGTDADGLPDADDDVTLAAGHTVTLDVAATVETMTVASGATLAPSGNVTLTTEGTMTNRGTLQRAAPYSSLWILAKGDVANYGDWTPWGTQLVGTRPQRLTQGANAPFQGDAFDLGPEAQPVAASDLAFSVNQVTLKGRTLDMRAFRLSFVATSYRTVRGDAGDGAPYGALRFAGGTLYGDPANAPILGRLRVEGAVTIAGTVRLSPSNDRAEDVTFAGDVTIGSPDDRSAVLSANEGCYCSAVPLFEGSLTNYGALVPVPYSGFSLRIAGDVANYGTWTPGETVLVGTTVQTLTQGPGVPFDGAFRLQAGASARAGSDLAFKGTPLSIAGGTFDIGARTLTLGDGTREVYVTGDPGTGASYGRIASEGGTLHGNAAIPSTLNRLFVDGSLIIAGTVHIEPTNSHDIDYVRFRGDVLVGTVLDGTAVLSAKPGCYCSARPVVEGDLYVTGTLPRVPYSGFDVTVLGDVLNVGDISGHSLNVAGKYTAVSGSTLTPYTVAIGGTLATAGTDTSDVATWPVLKDHRELTVGGLDVDGLVLDNTWLISDGGDLRQFDHVLIRNVPNDVTQVLIRHPGLPGGRAFPDRGVPARRFPVRHITFTPLRDYPGGQGSHDAGLYMAAVDTAPDDGNELAVSIEESSMGGGVDEWVDTYGSPEANYYGYFTGRGVFWPEVERAALIAGMERANFGNLALNNLLVAFPGQVVVEYDDRWKPIVKLCVDGPQAPCVDVLIQDGTYSIRATEGTQMSGNVEVPLEREPPAGTSSVLGIVDKKGNVIVQGGTSTPPADGTNGSIRTSGGNLIGAGGGNLIGPGGGNLIAPGGGNIIAAGGGNIIAAGGGNIIAAGGGNIIAAGGGNIIAAGGGNLTGTRTASLRAADDDSPLVEVDGLTLFVAFLPEVRLDARVLLDGALGSDPAGERPLRTTLHDEGMLPGFQPYLAGAFAETPKALPDTTVVTAAFVESQPDLVDWVVVELRDAEGRAFRRTALLRADGQVVDFDSSTVAFRGLSPGDYTVAVYHRTHATAVSAAPVAFGAGVAGTVDFTAAGVAAGDPREVAPGVFAQVSGDVDADGAVTAADLAAFAEVHGERGYSQGDLLLDGAATARDAHAALVPALAPRPVGAPTPGALDGRLVHTADPGAGTAQVSLELRGEGALGTSTFRLRYDTTAVRPLDGRALAFVGEAGGATYAYAPAGALVADSAGTVTVRVTLLAGDGAPLAADYAEAARLRFEVLDGSVAPGFAWDLVEAYDAAGGPGGAFSAGTFDVVDGGFAVAEETGAGSPASLMLGAPYPNPLRAQATVPFAVPAPGPVRLTVHDLLGRQLAVLADRPFEAGAHGADLDGSALAPGVYVVRLAAGGETRTARLTIVR